MNLCSMRASQRNGGAPASGAPASAPASGAHSPAGRDFQSHAAQTQAVAGRRPFRKCIFPGAFSLLPSLAETCREASHSRQASAVPPAAPPGTWSIESHPALPLRWLFLLLSSLHCGCHWWGGGGGGGGAKFHYTILPVGITLDVNSMFPNHSQSTRHFPLCDQAVVQS